MSEWAERRISMAYTKGEKQRLIGKVTLFEMRFHGQCLPPQVNCTSAKSPQAQPSEEISNALKHFESRKFKNFGKWKKLETSGISGVILQLPSPPTSNFLYIIFIAALRHAITAIYEM